MSVHRSKIVFISGPPRSGKDTAALTLLRRREDVKVIEFKQPIVDAICAAFGINAGEWARLMLVKDQPCVLFNGHSPREVMISFSEDWVKPLFGKHSFGNIALRRIDNHGTLPKLFVLSDSGFEHEASPVINAFGVANCLKIELHREGKTFANDSRDYWTYPNLQTVIVHNDHDMDFFMDHIERIVKKWLKEPLS